VTYRVLTGQIMHETNTFSRLATDLDAYRARYLCLGDEVEKQLRGTRTEIGGILDSADNFDWDLVHPIAANATPSGKVTADAWAELKGALTGAVKSDGPFDGVYLALHGAMVTETTDDAEGELIAELRALLGPDIPIVVTLDLHANVTDRMAAGANSLIAYRTYPHIDQYERAQQAADLLQQAMKGAVAPQALVVRGPMLTGANHGRSQSGPMVALLERAAEFEREKKVLAVSIQVGFVSADIEQAGPSIVITGDGNEARCREIADDLYQMIWDTRYETTNVLLTPEEAMQHIAVAAPSGKPFVVADLSDNPGGGGYGDGPELLRAMISARLENATFAMLTDPETVALAYAAGEGAIVDAALGGKVDSSLGAPIHVTGRVVRFWDGDFTCDGPMWKGSILSMGRSLVLRVGGIDVIVTTNRGQVTDHQTFLACGIDPRAKSVIAVKSAHHFRAAFEPIAREVLLVDSGALVSPDFSRRTYNKLRRPIWPLDMD
jgi:microcystin degradation protein MlrC